MKKETYKTRSEKRTHSAKKRATTKLNRNITRDIKRHALKGGLAASVMLSASLSAQTIDRYGNSHTGYAQDLPDPITYLLEGEIVNGEITPHTIHNAIAVRWFYTEEECHKEANALNNWMSGKRFYYRCEVL